ncbi:MAG: endonuclease MutS2 [Armatimonadetes bacterium]|nr:endonuclease MutS2 [Armatimonadota bacterium]NIM22974.1 endonuclease MutS2 [Armatimonadota bacterium]NIM66845.1 endonuclease MutS2 [Armatimonadota bacterium]NIM75385.1 endonuclease MutS2 [Armatimonadota bacterium]NIN05032.1 endonuclease MutS2 [Armatimonadota bacterium]
MDERSLRVLEYPAIRELVAERTSSSLGRELALQMMPATALEEVRCLLEQTSEARLLLSQAVSPMAGVRDVRAQVRSAAKGGVLTAPDLLDTASTLLASRRLRGILREHTLSSPRLAEAAQRLGSFREIEDSINACIDDRAQVRDSASDRLRSLRQKARTLHDNIMRRLESMVRASGYQRMLSEPVITVRRDRYCLPVRSEFRGEFNGILHDTSASGATCFMEPGAVVEFGNELQACHSQEEEEIRRILAQLSGEVGAKSEEILATLEALAVLDLIFARAAFSTDLEASEPDLDGNGSLEFISARHPLLKGNVVPIDVNLGEDFISLIITGPNTGGKTVTLKTIGLLTLMAQSGLHIPAQAGSRVAVFQQVFADIGDEQSLQQSLSTFSSHMSQIVKVMKEAASNSLVLLDEIGAGTDPAEGSALAKAVLTELYQRGCRTAATTHYGELKTFAYNQPGIENASVEFDPVTLKPTFHLRMGMPGASNAFAIASNLGLDRSIIGNAQEMMGESRVALDSALQRVEENQRTLAEERKAAAEDRLGLQRAREEYEALTRSLKHKRKEILSAARKEAREIVTRAKRRGESLLGLLRQTLAEVKAKERVAKTAVEISSDAAAQIASLEEEGRALAPVEEEVVEEPAGPPLTEVKRGQPVFVRSVRQRGTALSPADEKGMVEVQVGILRLSVPIGELEGAEEEPQQRHDAFLSAPRIVPAEIHLRGLRVEEATLELEEYLEQAVEAGLKEVRIIHGKGTGAVRNAAQELLRKHPLVTSIRAALPNEGGEGATLASLKSGEA